MCARNAVYALIKIFLSFVLQHVSVQNLAKGPVPLTLCQSCCNKYHCPFCLPAVFEPTERYARVCTHIESHRLKAVLHRGKQSRVMFFKV